MNFINILLFGTLFSLSLLTEVKAEVQTKVQAESAPLDRPSWMTDDVIRSIMAMNLTESQRGPFRTNLSNCLAGVQADVHKVTMRGGFDLEKKIKRANKYRWKTFERNMRQILSREQTPAFQRYLETQKDAVQVILSAPDSERIRWN